MNRKDSVETLDEVVQILNEREALAKAAFKKAEEELGQADKRHDIELIRVIAKRLVAAESRLKEVQDCRREIQTIKIYRQ